MYGDARGLERPWPLDPVPVLLAPEEFARLGAGLAALGQRKHGHRGRERQRQQ